MAKSKRKAETSQEVIEKFERFPRKIVETIKSIPSKVKEIPSKVKSFDIEKTTEKVLEGTAKVVEQTGKELTRPREQPQPSPVKYTYIPRKIITRPAPIQSPIYLPPTRRRDPMFEVTHRKFMVGDPFSEPSPFDAPSPFFPRKRRKQL